MAVSAFPNAAYIESPSPIASCQSQAYGEVCHFVAVEAHRVLSTGKKPGNSSVFPGSPLFLAVASSMPLYGGENRNMTFHMTPLPPYPSSCQSRAEPPNQAGWIGAPSSSRLLLGQILFKAVRIPCYYQLINYVLPSLQQKMKLIKSACHLLFQNKSQGALYILSQRINCIYFSKGKNVYCLQNFWESSLCLEIMCVCWLMIFLNLPWKI